MEVSRSPHSRLLVSILTVLVLWQGVGLAAQEGGTTFPVNLAPTSITIGDSWRQESSLFEATAEREVFVFSGTNDHLIIGYVSADSIGADPILAALGQHADALGPLVDLERGSYYALQSVEIGGTPYGIFSVFYEDRHPGVVEVHTYLAPVSTFDSGMESAQAEVTIGDQSAFLGVNARMLQAMITSFTGPGDAVLDGDLQPPLATAVEPEPTPEPEVTTPPVEDATPEPVSFTTPASTPESASVATPVPTAETPAAPANEAAASSSTPESDLTDEPDLAPTSVPEATPAGDTAASGPETGPAINATPAPDISSTPASPVERPEYDVSMYLDIGVQEDGHYVSPQFGTEVRWDAGWMILQTDDNSAVMSDPDARIDRLSLVSTEYPDIYVNITLNPAMDYGMSDWGDRLESRDKDAYPALIERFEEEQAVVALVSSDGEELFMYDLALSSDGQVFRELEVYTMPELSGEALDAVAGGIQIDSEPMFTDVAPEDVDAGVS